MLIKTLFRPNVWSALINTSVGNFIVFDKRRDF